MLKLALVFVAVFVVSEAGIPILKPIPCMYAPPPHRLSCVCGHCLYSILHYSSSCDCKTGWTGKLCSKGPCDTAPTQQPCGENGDCVQDGCAEKKKCVCKNGYTGEHCQISPCEAKGTGYCICGTCKNVKTAPFARCNCTTGWTGATCNKGPCDTAPSQPPCGQNGKCLQKDCAEKKTCVCNFGYTGKHCEIKSTIEGTVGQVFDAINDGNIESILSVYTNDTILIFNGNPFVQGLEAVRAVLERAIFEKKSKRTDLVFQNIERFGDDFACITATVKVDGRPAGFITGLKRINGIWLTKFTALAFLPLY